jgi:hypothetical protein
LVFASALFIFFQSIIYRELYVLPSIEILQLDRSSLWRC